MPHQSKIVIEKVSTSPWRWRQHGPPECWYPATSLHSVITQKTMTWIFITVKTSRSGSPKTNYLMVLLPSPLLHHTGGSSLPRSFFPEDLSASCSVLQMTLFSRDSGTDIQWCFGTRIK